ncbi:MAG TPA: DUF2917 domain-containing protein [Burkholderiales bacterium]|nr:DUF2917 domain-containing protein [Burkholderiales bacterium]
MDIALHQTRMKLNRDGLIAFRDGRGARIVCHSGTLWVTQESQIKDRILEAGDSLIVCELGLTVITALGPSALTVTEAGAAGSPPGRWRSIFAGLAAWTARAQRISARTAACR